jgi:hypothetical protein
MHGMVAIANRAQTIPFTPAPRARGQRGRSGWRQSFCSNPSDKRSFKRQSASQQSRLGSCSRDPLRYVDGLNLYRYVNGRSTRFVDPTGLHLTDICPPRQGPINPCKGGLEDWLRKKCLFHCIPAFKTPGQINSIAIEALSQGSECANKSFPGTPENQHPLPNQAVRHCVASAILRCNLGKLCARCLANERELYQRTCTKQSCSLTQRGIANNNHGIDLESVRCGSECDDCVKAQNGGNLDNRPEIPDANNPDPECKKLPKPR